MVILFGHMSKCETLTHDQAVQDLWLALDMLPRFRWRWERKDFNGGHPLIARLAEKVMDVDLGTITPETQPVLMTEVQWDTEISPGRSQQTTPTMTTFGSVTAASTPAPIFSRATTNGDTHTPPNGRQFPEVPNALFYPFYTETISASMQHNGNGPGTPTSATPGPSSSNRDYTQLIAAAAAAGNRSAFGSQESYVSEEMDTSHNMTRSWIMVR
jgi:hypothetical protein